MEKLTINKQTLLNVLKKTICFLKRTLKNPPTHYIIFGILLTYLPVLQQLDIIEYSSLNIYAIMIVYTVVALGLNLLLGFSGLVSLASAAFVGFGAYGVAYFANEYDMSFLVAALLTLIISLGLGTIVGLFSLRVEGIYLAIGTLFIAEIMSSVYKGVDWLTHGFTGRFYKYPFIKLFSMELQLDRNTTFYMLVIVMVICMIILYNLVHSKTGRALMAMSRSEHAAQAMGINVVKYRMLAFITATIFATTAGILYISFFPSVDPTPWNLNLSLLIIGMVVIGGFKSIFGTVIGVFIIHGIPTFYLKEYLSDLSGFSYIFSGVLIILVIMFYPNGTIFVFYDLKRLYYKIKFAIKKKITTLRGEKNE